MFSTCFSMVACGFLLGITPFAYPSLRLGSAAAGRFRLLAFATGLVLITALLGAGMGLESRPLTKILALPGLAIGLGLALAWLAIGKLARPRAMSMKWAHGPATAGFAGVAAGLGDAALTLPLLAYAFPALFEPNGPGMGALELGSLGLGLSIPAICLAEVGHRIPRLRELASLPSCQRAIGGLLLLAAGAHGLLYFHPRPKPADTIGPHWYTDEAAALAEGKRRHLPVMVDFSASWCFPCHALDELVFSQEDVVREIEKRVVPLRLDVTEDNALSQQCLKKYDVDSLPTVLFVTPKGAILDYPKLNGVVPPEAFLAALQSL